MRAATAGQKEVIIIQFASSAINARPLVVRNTACLVLFLTLSCSACEIDTKVTTDGRNPPTFKLSGTGGINLFRIVEAPSPGQSFLDATVLWEIKPLTEKHGTSASDLPSITYGIVPSGFVQTTPSEGRPPPLIEGKSYDAWAPTYNANGGGLWFTIRDGRAVPAQ